MTRENDSLEVHIDINSNTKVLFFQAFATGTQPFRRIIRSTPLPNAFSTLMKLDQDQTCSLHYAADMCRALTDGLLKMDAVVQVRGEVVSADLDDTVSLILLNRQEKGSSC